MRNKITFMFYFIFSALFLVPIAELNGKSDAWRIVQNLPSQIANFWYFAMIIFVGYFYFFYTSKNFDKEEGRKLFLIEILTFISVIVFYSFVFLVKGIRIEIVIAEIVIMGVYGFVAMSLLGFVFLKGYEGFDKVVKSRSRT